MFAILMLLVLAVNGGLFTGTIMYAAYKTARYDQAASLVEQIWRA